jgi:hypothetical protein
MQSWGRAHNVGYRVVNLADHHTAVTILRQVSSDSFEIVDYTDVELRRPVAVGLTRHRVPVIVRLIVNKDWCLARRVDDV